MIVHSILDHVKNTEGIYLAAVYSRTEEKGRELAAQYGCSRVYTDMDAFLGADEINTVYIATPNLYIMNRPKKPFWPGNM